MASPHECVCLSDRSISAVTPNLEREWIFEKPEENGTEQSKKERERGGER